MCWRILLTTALLVASFPSHADQTIMAIKIPAPPIIDGQVDSLWHNSPGLTTHDSIADIDISLRAAYTDTHLYFLVQFADASENRIHKSLHWNPQIELYQIGPEREDTFLFKWNMGLQSAPIDLSSSRPHRADVWYWKAHRTDHAGYADDKQHTFSDIDTPKSQPAITKQGKIMHLLRQGDQGTAAYQSHIVPEFTTPIMQGYELRTPTGSRADVRAKGQWQNKQWTIEFARALQTGNPDDVQFIPGNQYRFGVSRYEIAGRQPNPEIEQPNFGSGDISEHLLLKFEQ